MGEIGRWFCADVELGIIGIGVKADTMAVDDFTQQKYANSEEKGTQHRALGLCTVPSHLALQL